MATRYFVLFFEELQRKSTLWGEFGDLVTEVLGKTRYPLGYLSGLEDETMTANIGTLDRILRFVIGAVLFAQPLFFYGALLIGTAMLQVSVTRTCPFYSIFGIKTCRL